MHRVNRKLGSRVGNKPSSSGLKNMYSRSVKADKTFVAQDLMVKQRAIRDQVPEGDITAVGVTMWKYEHQKGVAPCTVNADLDSSLNKSGMGPSDYSTICNVCNLTSECCGHYGLFNINTNHLFKSKSPDLAGVGGLIINPLYHSHVVKILISVCNSCSTPFISKLQMKEFGFDKIAEPAALLTKLADKANKSDFQCRRTTDESPCKLNPIYALKDKSDKGQIRTSENQLISVHYAFMVLDAIREEDKELLGFKGEAHPRDLFIRAELITPPKFRPVSITEGDDAHLDPMTLHYKKIVGSKDSDELWTSVSEMHFQKGGTGREKNETTQSQLKAKTGLFSAGQTARQNQAGRSVGGGSVEVPPDYVEIPSSHASKFTVPEKVTSFNFKRLTDTVREGRSLYFADNKGNFMNSRKDAELRIGMTVYRFVQDGDPLLFSRQPVLTKLSLICLKARVSKDPRSKTYVIHLSDTEGPNADFDGDEFNLQVPQDPRATAEALYLLGPEYNSTNPADGTPVIRYVMNQVTYAYDSTAEDASLGPLAYISMLDCIENYVTEEDVEDLNTRLSCYNMSKYSGRAIFSLLFPRDFSMKYKRRGGEMVIIENGVLIQGQIDKPVLNSHNGIASNIIKLYGGKTHIRMLAMASLMAAKWLNETGFTVGPADLPEIPSDMEKRMEVAYTELQREMKDLGWTKSGRLEQNRELDLINVTSEIKGKVLRDAMKLMKDTNLFKISSEGAGTKGSSTNITHLSASVGQIYKNGKVVGTHSGKGTRAICYSQPFDTDPEMRGYSINSYTKGLKMVPFSVSQGEGASRTIDMSKNTPLNGTRAKNGVAATQNIITTNNNEKMTLDGKLITTDFAYGFDPKNMVVSGGKSLPFNVSSLVTQLNSEAGWRDNSIGEDGQCSVQRDYVRKEPTKPITNFVSEYERPRVVGERAAQLAENDVPRIPAEEIDYYDNCLTIAMKEYEAGLLDDFLSVRKYTDRKVSVAKMSEYA
uniref:DNA-directed RNA polymerase n=1 Tax=viral metagenome TaxID=1070528 RepID=A0A6C0JS40_9ZZZZ